MFGWSRGNRGLSQLHTIEQQHPQWSDTPAQRRPSKSHFGRTCRKLTASEIGAEVWIAPRKRKMPRIPMLRSATQQRLANLRPPLCDTLDPIHTSGCKQGGDMQIRLQLVPIRTIGTRKRVEHGSAPEPTAPRRRLQRPYLILRGIEESEAAQRRQWNWRNRL